MCNLFVSECYLWKCATIQGDIGFKGLLESMEICYNTYFQCAINICSLYVIGITMFPWNKSTLYLFMAWHRYQRVIHEKQIPKVTPDSDSGNEMLFMTISYLASVCDTRYWYQRIIYENKLLYIVQRRVWRYQSGNCNP